MTFPDLLPKLCPRCGSPYSEDWVGGYNGWICGSNSKRTQWRETLTADDYEFTQSIDCAVLHWKTRSLKAEDALQRAETNVRHWREECGKLASTAKETEQERDEVVTWIRVVIEELINAGGKPGDRTVALANLRKLIAARQREAGILE